MKTGSGTGVSLGSSPNSPVGTALMCLAMVLGRGLFYADTRSHLALGINPFFRLMSLLTQVPSGSLALGVLPTSIPALSEDRAQDCWGTGVLMLKNLGDSSGPSNTD